MNERHRRCSSQNGGYAARPRDGGTASNVDGTLWDGDPGPGFLHFMIRRIPFARYWPAGTITILLLVGMALPSSAWSAVGTPVGASRMVGGTHPVHMSSTQIELSGDERRLTVTVRLFTDDLENALRAIGHPAIVATGPAAAVDSALATFLRDRLQFSLDGGPSTHGRITGHQRDTEATLVTVEVPLTSLPSRIAIVQRVFFDRFDDQVNLIHVRFGSKKRSALLRRGTERAEFTL